ncbi:MAG: NAD-dependent epimerase/dehydratase family protein [Pseudobdellovibrionaceae bacterium]
MAKKVLVTGGAGYKGTLLTQALLEKGHEVTCMDNFMYGFQPILPFSMNPKFSVVNKDVRNLEKKDVEKFDVVYHLAGLSGFPACKANAHSAQTINVDATAKLVSLLNKDQLIVYASTTSLYGQSGKKLDETSEVVPVSSYGITKYEAEKICMKHPKAISFRFATIFGSSIKMRPELLLNDFVYKALVERAIVIFDGHSVRTFLHIQDAIYAYMMALENSNMIGEVYNVGADSLNFSKFQIAEKVAKVVEFELVKSALPDPDRRDFIIGFDKITKLGFKPTVSLEQGIEELVRLYRWYRPYLPFNVI